MKQLIEGYKLYSNLIWKPRQAEGGVPSNSQHIVHSTEGVKNFVNQNFKIKVVWSNAMSRAMNIAANFCHLKQTYMNKFVGKEK